jgi:hypothetical protein
MPHREAIARDGQSHYDLRRIEAAVLGVATLAQRAIGLRPSRLAAADFVPLPHTVIFLINLEVERGRVVRNSDILPVGTMTG